MIKEVVQAMEQLEPEMEGFKSRVDACIESATTTVGEVTQSLPAQIMAAEQRITSCEPPSIVVVSALRSWYA